MPTKTLLSLATVALLAVTASADQIYSVTSTNNWFTATIDVDSGGWTMPNSGGSATNGVSMICVDTGVNNPLTYTPAAETGEVYCVKGNLTIVRCATAPSALPDSPSAALGALAATSESWYGVSGSGWVALSGVDVPADDTADCDVMIEFTNATRQVRYSVDHVALTNSSGVAWLECGAQSSNTEVKKVGIAGCSNVKSLGAEIVRVYEVSGVSDTYIDDVFTALKKPRPDNLVAALETKGKNGIEIWKSLVLGLDASKEDAKPYTAPVQTNNGLLGFTLGSNVNPAVYGTNAKVSFDVYECDNEGTISGGSKGHADVGGIVEVSPENGVKYYKIKITITK